MTSVESANLFENAGAANNPNGQEILMTLLDLPGIRLEQIVSCGQASPEDFWYDQAMTEWV